MHTAVPADDVTTEHSPLSYCPVTDLFVKCHLKLHIDITLHYITARHRWAITPSLLPGGNLVRGHYSIYRQLGSPTGHAHLAVITEVD